MIQGGYEATLKAHYAGVRARLTAPPPPKPIRLPPPLPRQPERKPRPAKVARPVLSPKPPVVEVLRQEADDLELARARAVELWGHYREPAPYDHWDGCSTFSRSTRHRPVAQIIAEVAAETGVSAHEIVGQRRGKRVVVPRQKAIWLAYKQRPDLSLAQLGRAFNRDHTTILHSVKQHEMRMAREAA